MASVSTDRRMGVNGGLAIKVPVRVATTANITLSGEQTIDGVAVVTGDRVLVKNQTSGINNGIYEADSGTWARTPDADGSNDLTFGTLIKVNSGTAGSGFWFVSTTTDPIVIGTTSIAFTNSSTPLATISAFMQTVVDDTTAAAAAATLLVLPLTGGTVSGALTVGGLLTPSLGIVGFANNVSAAAGNMGELKTTTVATASAVSLVTATAKSIMSLSLTAGDWDVSATVQHKPAASTSITLLSSSISVADNTMSTQPGGSGIGTDPLVTWSMIAARPGANISQTISPVRVALAATTTIYLVCLDTFTVSTMSAFGTIRARRTH